MILTFLLYVRTFVKELDELRIDDCVAHDITILNFEKNLYFDEHSQENGTLMEEVRVIRNNMQHNYNLYQFNNSFDPITPNPTFESIEFCKDGKKMNYTIEDVKYHAGTSPDYQDKLDNQFEVKFPVHAPPQETRDIRIKYHAKAFEFALRGDIDWVQVTINAVTEKLRIRAKLEGELKKTHIITSPIRPDATGDILDIEVRDFSDERMWSSEMMYKNQKVMPIWKDNLMEWVIYRPKIGYKYRIYFTIKSKEPATGSCSLESN